MMLERKTVSQCVSADYCKGWNDAVDTMPKWISVEERLPEHLQYVLTAAHDGEMEVMYYDKEWPSCFCLWNGSYKKFNVTHWMHLPEPPKEEAT